MSLCKKKDKKQLSVFTPCGRVSELRCRGRKWRPWGFRPKRRVWWWWLATAWMANGISSGGNKMKQEWIQLTWDQMKQDPLFKVWYSTIKHIQQIQWMAEVLTAPFQKPLRLDLHRLQQKNTGGSSQEWWPIQSNPSEMIWVYPCFFLVWFLGWKLFTVETRAGTHHSSNWWRRCPYPRKPSTNWERRHSSPGCCATSWQKPGQLLVSLMFTI